MRLKELIQYFLILIFFLSFIILSVFKQADGIRYVPVPCGVQEIQPDRNGRIMGGVRATANSWPWMLTFGRFGSNRYWNHVCGATLLNNRWTMTAAHCMYAGGLTIINITNYQMIVGLQDFLDMTGVEFIDTDRAMMHEHYSRITQNNDIALIHLRTNVTFGRRAQPICLPDFDPWQNQISVAIGWGFTNFNLSGNHVLNQVRVPVLSGRVCNVTMRGQITDRMICAGFLTGGKDSCAGDSGGPLMYFTANKWVQTGIISWGQGCRSPGGIGVYTRVHLYPTWISSKIKRP